MKRGLIYVVVLLSMILSLLSGTSFSDEEKENPIKMLSGLQYLDLVKGSGREAHVGETTSVDYTGWLKDGTKFDSFLDRE